MPQLLILRHAKSDWDIDAATDFERPLSNRGRLDARRVGCWLDRRHWSPDHILCSPAKRARQTAVLICRELGISEADVVFDERIYGGPPELLMAILKDARPAADRIMLIGHNPDLDGLVRLLSERDPETPPDGKLLATATGALFDITDLPTLAPSTAKLVSITRPAEMGECE
jgi:phosphohistidine phosphatase